MKPNYGVIVLKVEETYDEVWKRTRGFDRYVEEAQEAYA